jgi:acyl carrier protein
MTTDCPAMWPIDKCVASIIAARLHVTVPPGGLSPDAHLASDLSADPIDQIEVALAIEDAFDITISDDEGASCETIGDWQRLVATRVGQRP